MSVDVGGALAEFAGSVALSGAGPGGRPLLKQEAIERFPRLWADFGQALRRDFPRSYDPELEPDAGVSGDALLGPTELAKASELSIEDVRLALRGLPAATIAGLEWNIRALEHAWLHPFNHLLSRAPELGQGELSRFVYFVRSTEFVKIGSANNPTARIAGLQCAHPRKLVILKTLRGGAQLERNLHRLFAHHRQHLEWFRLDGDLEDYIACAQGATR